MADTSRAERLTLREALKDFGFVWAVFTFINGLSVVSLLQEVFFDDDLVGALQSIVDGYEKVAVALSAIVEPSVRAAIDWVNQHWDWGLSLQSHWRALTIFLTITAAANVRTLYRLQDGAKTAAFAVMSLALTVVAAIVAGCADAHGDWISQGIIASSVAPLCSLTLAGLTGIKRAGWFVGVFSILFFTLVFALAFFVIGASIRPDPSAPALVTTAIEKAGRGFFAAGLLLVILGAYALFDSGFREGNQAAVRFGLVALGGFGVAAVVFAADAVLKAR